MKHPTVLIEIRTRLQSCQLYYHPEQPANGQQFVLDVNLSNFTITSGPLEETFQFKDLCTQPLRVSGLKADKENIITVRLKIQNYNEVFEGSSIDTEKFIPSVEKDNSVQIVCKCCQYKLLKDEIAFQRILPLPSSDFNPGDLFCHECCTNEFENKHKLDPKLKDLFYGNFFFKINSDLVCEQKTFVDKDVIYCYQCRTCLGSRENFAVKLWNCTVAFSPGDNIDSTPKSDFISAVMSVIKDSDGATCKIIIKNKSTDGNDDFLLIWVMDKHLPILVSSCNSNKLQIQSVVKLLYSHERSHSNLVAQWEKDVYSHSLDVAEVMFTEGLNYLNFSNSIFPIMFRQANNMNVGYLGLKF